ncbi:hypothetical protein LCGC14_0442320 [marine sediment metagenome]|uniref:Uncharacterized protein n=1 Tax=marine sediment metagenome TaxID=412755 RepID=A0A0F9T3H7_9ZZZZ
MKKVLMILLIGMFVFSLATVSAFDFDNIKLEMDITFDGKEVLGNSLLEQYKPIEIKNMFGFGRTQFEGYIDKHDETCGIECESIMKIKTGQDGVLIDDIIFKTLQEDESWIEQDVRSYQFYIRKGQDWISYNVGEEVKKGTYEVKLEAEKKPSRTVDWVIKTNGEWLEGWAVWGEENDLIISSSQTMCGNYTGYNNIIVNNSATITICDYNGTAGTGYIDLQAYYNVTVDSSVTINGDYKGGDGGNPASAGSGNNGIGDGAGLGGFRDTIGQDYCGGGSGAGGYASGGYGGGSPDPPASNRKAGGSLYELLNIQEVYFGSGGGSGADQGNSDPNFKGGDGGGGVRIYAQNVNVHGTINVRGQTPQDALSSNGKGAGQGGGSGGSVILIGRNINVSSSTFRAGGGSGSDAVSQDGLCCSQGGGGGSGGIIEMYYEDSITNTSLSTTYGGGALGLAEADGTCTADDGEASSNGIVNYNQTAYTQPEGYGIVTLNSPADTLISITNEVTFNATATVTGGATLTNMSLFTNESGTWEENGTVVLNNLIISSSQELCGDYVNYANIIINNSATITICDENGTANTGELFLHAHNNITIESGVTINGAAKGYAGGAAPTHTSGFDGTGTSPGLGGFKDDAGAQHEGGGSGAGGYASGGYGGGSPDVPSSNRKAGGSAYQTPNLQASYIGSGGGSGAAFGISDPGEIGGRGGASIKIEAANIDMQGTLITNGADAPFSIPDSAADGGSGGGGAGSISLIGNNINISLSSLNSVGGDGADGYGASGRCGQGGGGASGGLIEIYYDDSMENSGISTSYSGGALGTSPAEGGCTNDNGAAGGSGTIVYNETTYVNPNYETTNPDLFNASSTQIWNRTITDPIIWNVQACDSDGDCGFATANYSLFIDTEPPAITAEHPNSSLAYINSNDGNETLNVTFTDDNLDSCWYDYNGTNVSIDGCLSGVKNSTIFVLENSDFNMTIYSNDTVGNYNSEFIEWDYILFEVNQTFESTTVETALEVYEVNLNYDSTAWSSILVTLNYNGTETVGVVIGSGDDVSATIEVIVEPITVAVNKTFYWMIDLTNATGTFSFNSSTQVQEIALIDFALCNYNEEPQLFFETFSTLSPETILNATFASAWTLQTTNGSGVSLNRSFEDTTETNSTWGFCISPNSSTYTVSVAVTVDAVNYTPTTHYIVDTDYSGVGENITLYLLYNNDSTLTEIRVTTQDNTPVADVYTTIQRYDVGTDTFYNVAMTKSDNDGNDLVYLAWYDYWYKFIGVLEGEVVFTEGAKKVSETPQIFKTGEIEDLDYEKFGDILYSLIYNDVTENFVLTYIDPSGLTTSNCLRVIKRNTTIDYVVCETCQASSSATIYCNIASAGNGTFIASYYATGSPAYWIDQLIELKNIQNELFDEIGNDNGTGLAILVAGVVVSLFLVTPALGVLGAILGMVLGIALGFQPLDYTAFLGIVIIGGMIMWAVQK